MLHLPLRFTNEAASLFFINNANGYFINEMVMFATRDMDCNEQKINITTDQEWLELQGKEADERLVYHLG